MKKAPSCGAFFPALNRRSGESLKNRPQIRLGKDLAVNNLHKRLK